jgi:hypothetical protein
MATPLAPLAPILLLNTQSVPVVAAPLTPPPVVAERPPAAPIDPARPALAHQLVDLLHPEDEMVESNVQMWDLRVRRSAASDPMFAKIEAEYPGAVDAYAAGARPVAIEHARQFVRNAKDLKAQILAQKLSAADLQQLIEFFRSPVGVKIVHTQRSPKDIAKIVQQHRPGTGPVLSMQDVERSRARSRDKTIDNLSADELLQVMKFESRPVAAHYAQAVSAADAALLELVNHPDRSWSDREAEAGTRALDQFIAAAKRSRQ